MILFVFYFLVTGGLQLIIFFSFGSESLLGSLFTSFIQNVVHKDFQSNKLIFFNDFVPRWYLTASYNIILIGAMSFNLSAVGIILYCYVRKFLCKKIAMKQKIQIKMNEWLKGYVL